MSKNSKTIDNSNADSILYFLFFLLALALAGAMLPALLFALFVAFLAYQNRISGYFLIVGSLALGGVAQFLLKLKIEKFILSLLYFLQKSYHLLKNKAYKDIIYLYMQNYNAADWTWIFVIGTFAAGLLVALMDRRRIRYEAGYKPLAKEMEEVAASKQVKAKDAAVPVKINEMQHPKDLTLLGIDNARKIVSIPDNAKHIFLPGTTGSGKTVTISNFIESAMQKDYGLVCIDGKGDISDSSMTAIFKTFAEKYHRKYYIISLADIDNSDTYNPFLLADIQTVKDMLINMSEWTEEHYKLNTQRYIQRVLQLMQLNKIPFSFATVIENLPQSNFELLSAELTKQSIITKEEHLSNIELAKASGSIAAGAEARFADIAEGAAGKILTSNGVDIFKALQEGAAILFVLNPLQYPELSPAFGKLIMIDAKKAIAKSFTQSQQRKFFLCDEINVYASPILIDLVNKSRSAGVTALLATQSMADLEAAAGPAFKQQIIENCNNYIIMRQNSPEGAEELAGVLGTKTGMEITHQIGDGGEGTGRGSVKQVREFLYHPDTIKNLRTGEAIYLSKDNMYHQKIKIRKPL